MWSFDFRRSNFAIFATWIAGFINLFSRESGNYTFPRESQATRSEDFGLEADKYEAARHYLETPRNYRAFRENLSRERESCSRELAKLDSIKDRASALIKEYEK